MRRTRLFHFAAADTSPTAHNTYLVAHQLYGKSSSDAYKAHLSAGARCVEIDAWPSDNPMEPKVTHGMTLTDVRAETIV